MELLLEGYGIMGFVNGSNPCPARFSPSVFANSDVESSNSLPNLETNEYIVWKMHDRAIMQLVTAILSPIAVSCAIGSFCFKDLWTRLKEHFSTVSKTKSVISLKQFRAQLLAEEAILETNSTTPFLCAMLVDVSDKAIKGLILGITKGTTLVNLAMLSSLITITKAKEMASFIRVIISNACIWWISFPLSFMSVMQSRRSTAPYCNNVPREKPKCFICGKSNHTAWYCFHKDKHPMQAMNTVLSSQSVPGMSSHHSNSQVWLTDLGATNHMTSEFGNLSLATPYPSNEMVHTVNGEGQSHREDAMQRSTQ
ncbi:hypothetical protein D8674_042159 [Pyrus ussuriensis x Pyrus communis]|uniref:CCHC-type domain-containing protein n=1 Tax=Pyrus ussuriensis x Pyrus communis TaxID=2448454 RepID=A0A5N5H2V9_9ROSA|nr:hypothetical protein D8674_042159 [Pyrus ussuriensis x Pyrus communis]